MKYSITYSPEAQEGLAKLKRSEPASIVWCIASSRLKSTLMYSLPMDIMMTSDLIGHEGSGTSEPTTGSKHDTLWII